MVKVVRFGLLFKDSPELSYKDFCATMFETQRNIRQFKNNAASHYFDYLMKRKRIFDETGVYPNDADLLDGMKVRTYLYNTATRFIPDLQTGNVSMVSEGVYNRLKADTRDVLFGEKALPSFKKDQPIDIHKNSISFKETTEGLEMIISIFSTTKRREIGMKNGRLTFTIWRRNKSELDILNRCASGEYRYGSGSIAYNKSKKMWECSLTYEPSDRCLNLNRDRICGVDLGIVFPVYAAINDGYERLSIQGGDIDHFRRQVESRRRGFSKSRKFAGDGSVGHGYYTRVKPVINIGDKIARFRDTKNHQYSRAVVDFAVKNNCGIIQMEDLTGIAIDSVFLKNWSYFDLQQKIKYKAIEAGIEVVMVEPRYTSQRCHKCGYIHSDNRKDQSTFVCERCGYKGNADYNAAKNIATKDISEIITHECDTKANTNTA